MKTIIDASWTGKERGYVWTDGGYGKARRGVRGGEETVRSIKRYSRRLERGVSIL